MAGDLSDSELERYAAQIDRIGIDAQLRLKAARAMVVGAGRAGTTAAGVLASSGVGYVAIVDGETVALGDLGTQLLHYTPDVGAGKADSLAAKLGVLNPEVQADSYPVPVDEANAAAIVLGHDVVLDCTGDPSAATALRDACAGHGIALLRAPRPQVTAGAAVAEEALSMLVAREAEVRA